MIRELLTRALPLIVAVLFVIGVMPSVSATPLGTGPEPKDPDNDGMWEDVNGDGVANFSDAVALAFANYQNFNETECNALDFDQNDKCNFRDAVELAFQV